MYLPSSPTRGMWIEIAQNRFSSVGFLGHPPHGGCGLKFLNRIPRRFCVRRHPPHGGCGLKSSAPFGPAGPVSVIPHTGDVD